MAAAGTLDIVIDQGATWQLQATWQDSTGTPIDLTGYEARAQVRTAYADQGGDLLVALDNDGILLPTSTGIDLDEAEGGILLQISADDTESFPPGAWVWDLEVVSSAGQVTRLLMGQALVRAEVTVPSS